MRARILAVAVAVSLLASPTAFGQQSTPPMMNPGMPGSMMNDGRMDPMMGQGMMGQGMMGQGMMGQGMMPMMNPSQHVEGRLAFLKTELKITDAQATQWSAYAYAVRANAKRIGELMHEMMSDGPMMQGQPGTAMSLPDRLDRTERHIAAHMEMLATIKTPTVQLYDVLSEEQKRLADQLIGPMGMM